MVDITCSCPHIEQCKLQTCICRHQPECKSLVQARECGAACLHCAKPVAQHTILAGYGACQECILIIRNQCPKGSECRLYPIGMCTLFHGLCDKRPQCANCFRRRHPTHIYCWECQNRRKQMLSEHACRFTLRNCKFDRNCMDMHGASDSRPVCAGCNSMTSGSELCTRCMRSVNAICSQTSK